MQVRVVFLISISKQSKGGSKNSVGCVLFKGDCDVFEEVWGLRSLIEQCSSSWGLLGLGSGSKV